MISKLAKYLTAFLRAPEPEAEAAPAPQPEASGEPLPPPDLLDHQPDEDDDKGIFISVHNSMDAIQGVRASNMAAARCAIAESLKRPENAGLVFIVWKDGMPLDAVIAEGGEDYE